jgi:hypothetical protein
LKKDQQRMHIINKIVKKINHIRYKRMLAIVRKDTDYYFAKRSHELASNLAPAGAEIPHRVRNDIAFTFVKREP